MKRFLVNLQNYSYRYRVSYFLLIFCLFIFLCSGFVSCSDPNEGNLDSRENEGLSEEEEEDFAKCRGDDICEDVCKTIYNESWKECSRAGSEKVGNIQRIYSRLKQTRVKRSRLDEISDERDGMTIDHFKEYLEIGVDGWIKQIEGYSTKEGPDSMSYSAHQAQEVIRWLAREDEISEVLLEVNNGSKVLETLLNATKPGVPTNPTTEPLCFWRDDPLNNDKLARFNSGTIVTWFGAESAYDITIEQVGSSDNRIKIKIDGSKYRDLYDLLSCTNVDGSGEEKSDIFSVAAYEDNEALFNVAFNLLDEVCRDSVLTGHDKEEDICRRAMLCVLAIYYMDFQNAESNDTDVATWDGWNYAAERFDINGFDEDEACGINDDHTEFGGNIDI